MCFIPYLILHQHLGYRNSSGLSVRLGFVHLNPREPVCVVIRHILGEVSLPPQAEAVCVCVCERGRARKREKVSVCLGVCALACIFDS